jgi:Pyridoxamine 5'-phosphate oxidase
MDAAELRAFLERSRYGVLATADSDRPIAWPALFTVVGASFWFASVEGVRPDGIRRTRWASLVVINGEPGEHGAVAADGELTIIEQPPARVLEAWRERHGHGENRSGIFLELAPRRVLSFIAGKG